MVERKEYLDELIGWKDEQVIKVVTGIRRCGKSTLLAQYQTWLKENGIADAQIVSINFEELEYEELLDYKKLYAYLKERLIPEKNTYIFLDEIQKVADFEKVVDCQATFDVASIEFGENSFWVFQDIGYEIKCKLNNPVNELEDRLVQEGWNCSPFPEEW